MKKPNTTSSLDDFRKEAKEEMELSKKKLKLAHRLFNNLSKIIVWK